MSNLTLQADTPSLQADSPRLPHSLELTVLLREFIQYWTGLKTDIPLSPSLSGLENPIEFTTRWNGSVKGTLVFRTSWAFREKLVQVFQEKGTGMPSGNAVLQEMATLYSIFLVHYAWLDELFELGPILARPSQPAHWPSKNPHAFCAVEVEGEPLEIRLWIEAPDIADSLASLHERSRS